MTISIQESDWKYLRKRNGDMLSTLCGRINEHSKDILNDQSVSEHEKYLKLYDHIKKSDKFHVVPTAAFVWNKPFSNPLYPLLFRLLAVLKVHIITSALP